MVRPFLFVAVDDSATAEVIRAHLNAYFVSWQDTDVVHAHFTGNSGNDFVPVLKPDAEHRVAECFDDNAVLLDE